VRPALERSLADLGLAYLDLYLIHWPVAHRHGVMMPQEATDQLSLEQRPIAATWRAMEELVRSGLVRHIGVSNFRIEDIEELLSVCSIPPFINQIEFNPYLQQPDLQAYCKGKGILVAAYAPLGPINLWPGGPLDPIIEQLSEKYSVPSSSILLRYASQKGFIVITTSTKKERLTEYLSCFIGDAIIELTPDELKLIDDVGSTLTKRMYWTNNF
jgi:alcohol dehydrogenase (NADP+)